MLLILGGFTLTYEEPEKDVLGTDYVYAEVTKVIDGDTFEVSIAGESYKVRMIGIDTPETVHPQKEVECFGKEAFAKTAELLSGATVILTGDSSQDSKDKYGRLLKYVHLEDGTFVNKVLIESGYAYEYTYDAPYKYQSEFRAAQKYAEDQELGLWNESICP